MGLLREHIIQLIGILKISNKTAEKQEGVKAVSWNSGWGGWLTHNTRPIFLFGLYVKTRI